MKLLLLVLLVVSLNDVIAQRLDTTYSFQPCLFKSMCSISSLSDTGIKQQKISFRIDTSEISMIYGDIRSKKGNFFYNGPIQNELLFVEIRNDKGELLKQCRYKLSLIAPLYNVIISKQTGEPSYKIRGLSKDYIQDGYSYVYKNGRQVSSVYFSDGKPLKLKD